MPHQITRAKKERLVVLLGECLLKSGCPGHRAEEALQHSASILGLTNASFSLLPETVLVTFMSDGGNKHQQSLMIKSPTSLDMGKIGQVHQIMNRCLIQQANTKKDDDDVLDQCIQALQHVSNSPPTWGFLGTLFSFFVSSFTACAMLFDGSWIDCILSGILGLVVAVLFVLASCRPIYGRVFEISACVFVSALAQALHAYCCFTSVAVSGVLNLLPGYAMTMAVVSNNSSKLSLTRLNRLIEKRQK
ncbi:hypothetical protein BDB00DRAFT_777468 [Zychaea mexicana]|uniref:uncharacterized protein n=1 Tax=Zychaea mexicana TaxID=64656 RepID=UPI0022FED77B|nr:uncharacterized protein BDB00DRAFT_777468 [Zychaea mexicana]KAI9467938.1 hypothetical protein BDB00DRAFT_777468 [Zychaea mexicana]